MIFNHSVGPEPIVITTTMWLLTPTMKLRLKTSCLSIDFFPEPSKKQHFPTPWQSSLSNTYLLINRNTHYRQSPQYRSHKEFVPSYLHNSDSSLPWLKGKKFKTFSRYSPTNEIFEVEKSSAWQQTDSQFWVRRKWNALVHMQGLATTCPM